MKIFCFPFAGGGGSFFDEMQAFLDKRDELITIEYPGHGMRLNEKLCFSASALAEDVYYQIQTALDGSAYTLFAYSMGCIILTEVIHLIKKRNEFLAPNRIILGAHAPIDRSDALLSLNLEDDYAMKKLIISFGGIPEYLQRDDIFWKIYLPIYRADYSILRSYKYPILDLDGLIPIDVVYSENDTKLEEVEHWKDIFGEGIVFHCFEGGHFFARNYFGEIYQLIKERS